MTKNDGGIFSAMRNHLFTCEAQSTTFHDILLGINSFLRFPVSDLPISALSSI